MKDIVILPGNYLKYQKDYTPDYVEKVIKENKLNGLRIFAILQEDRIDSFGFLIEYTFLEGLGIASRDDYDYEFLKSLTNLKRLSIQKFGEYQIDLSHQINLESLSLEWRKKIVGLENCQKLTCLCLVDFKKEADLRKISMVKNLKELTIKTASIKSVEGVSRLTSLERVSFGNCRSLKSVKDLNGLKSLKKIEFSVCSKIQDYHLLTDLPKLECLEFTSCRDIASIKFIENFPKLKRLVMSANTNILDSDLRPAQKVEKVFYNHRDHYNLKIENKEHEEIIKRNREKLKCLSAGKWHFFYMKIDTVRERLIFNASYEFFALWKLNNRAAVTTFNYNWDGKLRQADWGNDYLKIKYDPDGNRVYREAKVGQTTVKRKFIVDYAGGLPVILLELDFDNSNSVKKTYIHAHDQIIAQHDGDYYASRYFYLQDRLGSVRQIIDVNASVKHLYTYGPFGKKLEDDPDPATLANPFQFAGQYYDTEIGQLHLRARQYDPHLQRLTS